MEKKIAYNFVFQLFTYIVSFITMPYLSRILGSESIGIYSYCTSVASVFALFSMLGINKYGTRLCAQNMDNRKKLTSAFWGIYYFQFFMCIIVVLFYLIYITLYCKENRTIFIILTIAIISPFFDVNWFFNGIEEFKVGILRNFIVRLITIILIFTCVRQRTDLWKYVLIMHGGNFAAQLVTWTLIFRYIDFSRPRFQEIRRNVLPIIRLFMPAIGVSIYTLIDKIMLGQMCDMNQQGYYEQSERIVIILHTLLSTIGTVALPRISFLIKNGKNEMSSKITQKMMVLSLIMGSAFAGGIAGIASNFVVLYLGNEFSECASILRILTIDIIAYSWGNVILTQYILPMENDAEYIKTTFIGAAVNLVINIILLPRLGAVAAAISTSAAQLAVSLYMTFVARKQLPIKKMTAVAIPILFIGLTMACLVNFVGEIDSSPINVLIMQILAGTLYYALGVSVCLYVLRYYWHKEIKIKDKYSSLGK